MTAKPQPVGNGKSLLGGLVFVVLIGSVIYSCSTSSGEDDGADSSDRSGMAEVMCEEFVTDRLKAPSTAEFLGASSVDLTGREQYEVTASVDSQNGFGAMIRTPYVCLVNYEGDDQWKLVNLAIDE
jgi:hypothetical protein